MSTVTDVDSKKISWSVNLKSELSKGRSLTFATDDIVKNLYRPYSPQHLYFDRRLIERVLQLPKMFPVGGGENLAISIKGNWSAHGQIALMVVVNGKPALEWVMERQCVKTDPASGIINDANRYAIETADDPAYPFKLFCRIITVSLETMKIVRIITVSLETMKIVNSLPGLDIREEAVEAVEPETAAAEHEEH